MDEYDKRVRMDTSEGNGGKRRKEDALAQERQSERKRDREKEERRKEKERASNINGKFNRRLVRAVSSDARRVSRAPEVNQCCSTLSSRSDLQKQKRLGRVSFSCILLLKNVQFVVNPLPLHGLLTLFLVTAQVSRNFYVAYLLNYCCRNLYLFS